MGCSASKGSTRKRSARESWYAPVSRCTSAPIRYTTDAEDNNYDSPSTPYGISDGKALFQRCNKSSLASMLQEEDLEFVEGVGDNTTEEFLHELHVSGPTTRGKLGYGCEPRKRVAVSKAYSRYNSTLIPVAEVSECSNGDVDTIKTWELMKRLDDDDNNDDSCRISKPIGMTVRWGVFEKSQSFNKVHGLDSCFAELHSPVQQKCFSEQGTEPKFEGAMASKGSNLCAIENKSDLTSSAGSPLSSPSRTSGKTPAQQSPLRSPYSGPVRSPLKSPLMGSSSPLFEPSLLAKFEQAVDATALPQDDWFRCSSNEGSMTTSSSSFYNHTWGSSETSSDGDSTILTLQGNPLIEVDGPLSCKKNVCKLENFEIRCPPKGGDKVVLYFTSLRGVRKTYEDCYALRRILQGLGVHVDERDVWMHSKFREELRELMDNNQLQVPRLFIKGRYIGGVEEVCQLHEDGLLVGLINDMPCFGSFRKPCEGCAGMRFIPCIACHGSCKFVDEMDRLKRCSECNENGLMLCPLCS